MWGGGRAGRGTAWERTERVSRYSELSSEGAWAARDGPAAAAIVRRDEREGEEWFRGDCSPARAHLRYVAC